MDIVVDTFPDPRLPFSPSELADLVRCLARTLQIPLHGLAIRITHDQEMAELHARFAGGLGPTNVLSFPTEEPDRLGDLVLSADTVAREPELYLQPFRAYAARLVAHGLLHLAGLPHGPEMDALMDLAVAECAADVPGFAWGEP
ncbi:MAG: metalloprotease [Desulfomicrobiaceae bacterium]|jgi:probable rRNA maturation factor|nr:metalloprotease [Desulfomicrobiaceae bacterium]